MTERKEHGEPADQAGWCINCETWSDSFGYVCLECAHETTTIRALRAAIVAFAQRSVVGARLPMLSIRYKNDRHGLRNADCFPSARCRKALLDYYYGDISLPIVTDFQPLAWEAEI
jgi:hypothetical protein